MRRHNYTITELLTVIAIIAILAAIAIPSVGYARKRSRTTACVSNQGQTMKVILNSMADTNNRLYSGSKFDSVNKNGTVTTNAGWTVFLAEKGYIKNMDAMRCPEIRSYTTDGKVIDEKNVEEAYGVVVASGNNGKFDFRGTKLLTLSDTDKTQIAPSALAIGGCATSDGEKVAATINFASSSGGRATGVHHNDMSNIFFFDGHVETVSKADFAENKYFPSQGDSSAQAVAVSSAAWLEAKK